MPCQGGMSYQTYVCECSDKIDELTQMLCYLTASLYKDGLLKKYGNADIIAWHQDHMHKDELRVGREMQKIFKKNPHKLDDEEFIVSVADQFYLEAVKVHPVSDFHEAWFDRMAQEAAREIKLALEEKEKKQAMKATALNKLSEDDKKVLGLA